MYIEQKSININGNGCIGWVEYSKSKRTMKYKGKSFAKCVGYKYNCYDVENGDEYWITGPKKRGGDKLYGGKFAIDENAREEYWVKIRNMPERMNDKFAE